MLNLFASFDVNKSYSYTLPRQMALNDDGVRRRERAVNMFGITFFVKVCDVALRNRHMMV